MLTIRGRSKALITGLVLILMATLPGIAQAGNDDSEETTTTTTPVPPVTQVTSVLPVLGSGLTVSLTRDASGVITEVALDPSGATVVKEGDHKVVFLLADGDTQVVVKSFSKGKGDDAAAGGVKTTVTADATADVTGDGSWSADVFGTGVVTIPYTVAFDGNVPSVTIGDIVLPDGVTAEVGDPKVKTSDEKSKFRIKVTLMSGENEAKVSFLVSTRLDEEGQLRVKLAVTLNSRDHVRCGWGHDRDHHGDDDGQVSAADEDSGRHWGSGDGNEGDHDRENHRDHDDGDHDGDHDGGRHGDGDDEGQG
jgi:hypothetical protein